MALVLKKGEGANLLSLDGGGIKGISTLVILKAIMDRVKVIEKKSGANTSDDTRLPVDYFHLTGGTSTGGIIAVMLIRLRMSVEKTIEEYFKIGPKVFGATLSEGEAKFAAKPLEEVVDDILSRFDTGTITAMKATVPKAVPNRPTPGQEVPKTKLVDNQGKM
jgi:patatin-like phospholipase/acyl hydrolase